MEMANDKLIALVVEQMISDYEMGDEAALYDFIDLIPRQQMINYLGYSRQQEAVEEGIITDEEYSA